VFAVTEGQALGDFYTVTALSSIDQLRPDKTPYIDPATAGDYEVVNGMVVNKTTKRVVLTDPNDQRVVGNAYPDFNMSFLNTIAFKQNLILTFQFDWIQGNSIIILPSNGCTETGYKKILIRLLRSTGKRVVCELLEQFIQ
jgi:hypothetical protein